MDPVEDSLKAAEETLREQRDRRGGISDIALATALAHVIAALRATNERIDRLTQDVHHPGEQ